MDSKREESKPKSSGAAQTNEGEGSRSAARRYNEAQRRFAESGQVEERARDAERALAGPERPELEEAEAVGKSRAVEEDPTSPAVRGPTKTKKI